MLDIIQELYLLLGYTLGPVVAVILGWPLVIYDILFPHWPLSQKQPDYNCSVFFWCVDRKFSAIIYTIKIHLLQKRGRNYAFKGGVNMEQLEVLFGELKMLFYLTIVLPIESIPEIISAYTTIVWKFLIELF